MKTYLYAIFIFIVSCDSVGYNENSQNPILPASEVRYLESSGQIRAILQLKQGDSLATAQSYTPASDQPPLFLGSPMQFRETRQRWMEERELDWTGQLRFAIPRPADSGDRERLAYEINMDPPTIDSIPTTIDLSRGSRFRFGDSSLEDNESLLIFFETREWNPGVKRILIAGPTSDSYARLPPEALRELPAGNYELYLVKQKLSRDTIPGLRASTQIEYFTKRGAVEVVGSQSSE